MYRRNLYFIRKCLYNQASRCSHNWINPQSNDTTVFIHNPICQSKVPLMVENKNFLSWYSCGPTVYDETHIGHASSYVRLDIIQRILSEWFDIESIVALGITDIDDKIISRSKQLNLEYSLVAKKFEVDFLDAMMKLNVRQPQFILRVTEHIPEIINFVENILKSGHAYSLDNGDVLFDARSLPNYGKITRAPVLTEDSPPKEGPRRHAADFTLWKFAKPNEPSWMSPWGPGRPGWHIECSAMASKVFGKSLDVHSGGLDLAFPHHENEEAQSCACHSTSQWVNYWVHTGHLLMNGMKMSKSMKNFVTVSKFLNDFTPDQFRMLCLLTHYRTSINYTDEVMQKSVAVLAKLETFINDAANYCSGSWTLGSVSGPELLQELDKAKSNIRDFLKDDFNTAQCVNQVESLVKLATAMLHAKPTAHGSRDLPAMASTAQFVQNFLHALGMLQSKTNLDHQSTDFIIEKAVSFRNEVRTISRGMSDKTIRSQLLRACDTLRTDFEAGGVVVKDLGKDGSCWSRTK